MSSGVVPLGKIVYVCDDVLRDAVNKTHVIGAFDAVRPPDGANYPFDLDHLCVFAQFAGGLGHGVVQVKVVEAASGDEVFGSPVYQVNFPGGQQILTLVIRILDCPFPQPGAYLVQLFCQGAFVDDRLLTAL